MSLPSWEDEIENARPPRQQQVNSNHHFRSAPSEMGSGSAYAEAKDDNRSDYDSMEHAYYSYGHSAVRSNERTHSNQRDHRGPHAGPSGHHPDKKHVSEYKQGHDESTGSGRSKHTQHEFDELSCRQWMQHISERVGELSNATECVKKHMSSAGDLDAKSIHALFPVMQRKSANQDRLDNILRGGRNAYGSIIDMTQTQYARETQAVEKCVGDLQCILSEVLFSVVECFDLRKTSYVAQLKKMREVSNSATRNAIQTCKMDATSALNQLKHQLDREKSAEFAELRRKLREAEAANGKIVLQMDDARAQLHESKAREKEVIERMQSLTEQYSHAAEESLRKHVEAMHDEGERHREAMGREREKLRVEAEGMLRNQKELHQTQLEGQDAHFNEVKAMLNKDLAKSNAEIVALKEQVKVLTQQLAAEHASYHDMLQAEKSDHEAKISQIHAEHVKGNTVLKADFTSKIQRLKEEEARRIEEFNETVAAEKEKLLRRHIAELEVQESDHTKELKRVQATIETRQREEFIKIKHMHELELSRCIRENERLTRLLARATGSVASLSRSPSPPTQRATSSSYNSNTMQQLQQQHSARSSRDNPITSSTDNKSSSHGPLASPGSGGENYENMTNIQRAKMLLRIHKQQQQRETDEEGDDAPPPPPPPQTAKQQQQHVSFRSNASNSAATHGKMSTTNPLAGKVSTTSSAGTGRGGSTGGGSSKWGRLAQSLDDEDHLLMADSVRGRAAAASASATATARRSNSPATSRAVPNNAVRAPAPPPDNFTVDDALAHSNIGRARNADHVSSNAAKVGSYMSKLQSYLEDCDDVDDIEGPLTQAMVGGDGSQQRKGPAKTVVPFVAIASRGGNDGDDDASVDSLDNETALTSTSTVAGAADTTSQLLGSSALHGGNNRSQFSVTSDGARLLGSTPDVTSSSTGSSPGDVRIGGSGSGRASRREEEDHVLLQGAGEDDDLAVHYEDASGDSGSEAERGAGRGGRGRDTGGRDSATSDSSVNDDEYFANNIITHLASPQK